MYKIIFKEKNKEEIKQFEHLITNYSKSQLAEVYMNLQQEKEKIKEKISFAIEDLNQLQEEIFGGDEYLNWIVSEIEKVKIRLLGDKMNKEKIFENEVYEKQRLNIERLAKENPDDWFYKMQMELPANKRVGFAPLDYRCWNCGKDITKGEKAITVESLGNYIILGCPYCYRSYCD